MMVLKKKEIVDAALVVLIGVAGYLNWSYQDTVRVTDGELYAETGKRLGEAQYVSTSKNDVEDKDTEKKDAKETKKSEKIGKTEDTENQFAAAKLEKENARSKSLEILNQTAANESFDEDTRKKAQERILKMAENVEKEATIENIARAKGYTEVAVYIDGEAADMIINRAELSEDDIRKLKAIVSEQLNIGAKDIKIVPVK